MVPGQGMIVFGLGLGLGLGLVTGGDRLLAMPLAKTGKSVYVKYDTVVRPSRSVPSLRICTQGSSNFGPGPSRVPKAVLILVIKEEKSF